MKIKYQVKRTINKPYSEWKKGDRIIIDEIHELDKEDFRIKGWEKGTVFTLHSCRLLEDAEGDPANGEFLVKLKGQPHMAYMAKSFKLLES